ncbi:hypothetical protein CP8484711_1867B, partial [Chlamydia psittaci 84-8471/1]
ARVINATPGVGMGPNTKVSIPIEVKPATRAFSNIYPDKRVSLPTTTRCFPDLLSCRTPATAFPNNTESSTVIGS